MRIGSLFSGAGGLDMAVEQVFGATTAWHCELDPAATKVLAHHWPHIPNLGDITTIDWATVEPVDILCGGFPCTDVSSAGRRAGLHNTRSGLWTYYADAINALQPQIVVIENVRGLLSAHAGRPMEPDPVPVGDGGTDPVLRAAGAVLGDLADLGYDTQWATVAASSIGAPHRRERVFIVARDLLPTPCVTDRTGTRNSTAGRSPDAKPFAVGDTLTDALTKLGHIPMGNLLPTPQAFDRVDHVRSLEKIAGNLRETVVNELLSTPQSRDHKGVPSDGFNTANLCRDVADLMNWGKYEPAIRRWEALTRPAPPPTEPNTKGNPRLSAAFSEWMLGWPAGWVTAVPGLSRNDALRIIGNGVVTQQATAALRYLLSVAEVAA